MTVFVVQVIQHHSRGSGGSGPYGIFTSWEKAAAKAREHQGYVTEWDPATGKQVVEYQGENLEKVEE